MSKTVIAILLDQSGSMFGNRLETISGYNDEVRSIKDAPIKEGDEVFVCLYTFDYHLTEHLWMEPAKELQESNAESYMPHGGTAYYDALAAVSNKILESVDEDTDVLIKVISDGKDQNSLHYTAPEVKEIVSKNEATGHWTYTFLGCKDIQKAAAELGINVANAAVWSNDSSKAAMMGSAQATANYLYRKSAGVAGAGLQNNFYSDKQEVANLACNAVSDAVLKQTQPDQFDFSKISYSAFAGGKKVEINKSPELCSLSNASIDPNLFKTCPPMEWKQDVSGNFVLKK